MGKCYDLKLLSLGEANQESGPRKVVALILCFSRWVMLRISVNDAVAVLHRLFFAFSAKPEEGGARARLVAIGVYETARRSDGSSHTGVYSFLGGDYHLSASQMTDQGADFV